MHLQYQWLPQPPHNTSAFQTNCNIKHGCLVGRSFWLGQPLGIMSYIIVDIKHRKNTLSIIKLMVTLMLVMLMLVYSFSCPGRDRMTFTLAIYPWPMSWNSRLVRPSCLPPSPHVTVRQKSLHVKCKPLTNLLNWFGRKIYEM